MKTTRLLTTVLKKGKKLLAIVRNARGERGGKRVYAPSPHKWCGVVTFWTNASPQQTSIITSAASVKTKRSHAVQQMVVAFFSLRAAKRSDRKDSQVPTPLPGIKKTMPVFDCRYEKSSCLTRQLRERVRKKERTI